MLPFLVYYSQPTGPTVYFGTISLGATTSQSDAECISISLRTSAELGATEISPSAPPSTTNHIGFRSWLSGISKSVSTANTPVALHGFLIDDQSSSSSSSSGPSGRFTHHSPDARRPSVSGPIHTVDELPEPRRPSIASNWLCRLLYHPPRKMVIMELTLIHLKLNPFIANKLNSLKVKGLEFEHYLLQPMQRLTRYPLLISQIIKFTEEESQDYVRLNHALQKVQQVLVATNEAIREQEHEIALATLSEQLMIPGSDAKLNLATMTRFVGHVASWTTNEEKNEDDQQDSRMQEIEWFNDKIEPKESSISTRLSE
ncbi:hypothetical protein H4Q26_000806 [Puccinia striiformis f. sp. tritici PST-130]|nr:hypothetical protein H4Q26_000806 [Puccinia striiformis f. sp. tritici PST-130]